MESLDGDDTAFYAELTRQIVMLMDDDNNETYARQNIEVGSKFQKRLASCGGSGDYFSYGESVKRFEVPIWMERLWANNAVGTGVFIPRVEVAPNKTRRRRNKSRKNNVNDGGRMHSSVGVRIHG